MSYAVQTGNSRPNNNNGGYQNDLESLNDPLMKKDARRH